MKSLVVAVVVCVCVCVCAAVYLSIYVSSIYCYISVAACLVCMCFFRFSKDFGSKRTNRTWATVDRQLLPIIAVAIFAVATTSLAVIIIGFAIFTATTIVLITAIFAVAVITLVIFAIFTIFVVLSCDCRCGGCRCGGCGGGC